MSVNAEEVVEAPVAAVEVAGATVPPGALTVVSADVTVSPAPVLLTAPRAAVTKVTAPAKDPVPPSGAAMQVVFRPIVAVEQVVVGLVPVMLMPEKVSPSKEPVTVNAVADAEGGAVPSLTATV